MLCNARYTFEKEEKIKRTSLCLLNIGCLNRKTSSESKESNGRSSAFNKDIVKNLKSNYITEDENVPVVYYINEITLEALVKVYEALGYEVKDKIRVKVSTGESESSNYLRPSLMGKLVKDKLNASRCFKNRTELDKSDH